MFEKEAEEYQIANYDYGKTDGIADAFQDGAEFGYNKAKEELERQKWNDIFLEDCAVYDKKIAEEYTTLEEQIAKLKEENKELKEVHESDKRSLALIAEKGAELEEKISILLSCKNCPENKGGYICQKEYEDKCLAQKIQYIKELKEEIEALANVNIKAQNIIGKAKDLIRNLLRVTYGEGWNYSLDVKVQAEDFLKENEIKC